MGNLVWVEWIDPVSADEWSDEKDLNYPTIEVCGFLIHETDDKIVIAGDIDHNNGNYGRRLAIPKACIKSRVELTRPHSTVRDDPPTGKKRGRPKGPRK